MKSDKIFIVLILLIFSLMWSCNKNGTDPNEEMKDTEYTTLDENRVLIKDYGKGTGTITWTSDKTWILDGFVFVNDGQTLTIEAGTVIKGRSGTGANASALIIAQGGKIKAEGSAEKPIIFTAEADDLSEPLHGRRGLWGGLILLGKARINTALKRGHIEGIPEDEKRGAYGGDDDNDNSGVLKYVSIRHGGTEIGQGNEINGLTLGAVGNGTEIDYIEVVYNKDDGYEWFGGTVMCKHLVSAFNGDDSFDYDEGFRGKGQFWFSLQANDAGDRAGEHDGGTEPEDGKPFAIPTIANVTYIGSGANSSNIDNLTFKIRDNAGSKYYNSIFYDFPKGALDIEETEAAGDEDSRKRLDSGDIDFRNNLWYSFGKGNDASALCKHDYEQIIFSDQNRRNQIVDPQFANISPDRLSNVDPRPAAADVINNLYHISDSDFANTNYKGAFDPNGDLWIKGWTFLSNYNITVQ